ncbi:MAG: hypothetical protein LBH90_07285, partial [Tannerella sp.]|nr:hypothetical protein [Tannerella sp.]
MKADSKYDKFEIGAITDLHPETACTTVKIEKLNRRLVSEITYGTINISNVAPDFSEIKAEAAYSTLNIGLNKSHKFKATLYARYGN